MRMATRVSGALVLSIALWLGTGIAIDDPPPETHVNASSIGLATTAYPIPDGAVFVANAAFLALALRKWFGDMRALEDR